MKRVGAFGLEDPVERDLRADEKDEESDCSPDELLLFFKLDK